jgi:SET domain-containing protein
LKKREIKRRIRIGQSRIHGRGVFATTTIRRGARVVEYLGEIITEEEAERRGQGRRHVWFFDLDCGHVIDGDPRLAGPCVNHSCQPNCFTEIDSGRVFIVALRTIRSGEELTYDYRLEPDVKIWRCRCGAPRCRGTINRKPRRKAGPARSRRA